MQKNTSGIMPVVRFSLKSNRHILGSLMSSLCNCRAMCQPIKHDPAKANKSANVDAWGRAVSVVEIAINKIVAIKNLHNQGVVFVPNSRAVDLMPISASSSVS